MSKSKINRTVCAPVKRSACELTVCVCVFVFVFVFVSGAVLVAVRLKKPKATPRSSWSITGCPLGLRCSSD